MNWTIQMKTENDRLERTPKMTKTMDLLAAWSKTPGTLIAKVGSGALVTAVTFSVAILMATPIFAQGGIHLDIQLDQDIQEIEQDMQDVAKEVQNALDEIGIETGIKIKIDDDENDSRPKLGVYLNNMDFEDAYKMRYPYAHGVLVNGTVNNGAADKAGIIEDDIIMYFDGTKVRYEDHLVRLIRSKKFGDQAKVLFWRDGAIDSTMVTFDPPVVKEKKSDASLTMVSKDKQAKKHKNSHGYGGGGFTPMFIQDNFTDVRALMTELGLSTTPFNSDGVVLWGGSGQGYVGNGWFLGGFGNGTTLSSTAIIPDGTGSSIDRDITFSMGLGGLTIEKRLAPFSWATLSGGVGIGGGGMDLNVTQKDGDFNWSTVGDSLLTTRATSVSFSKNYAIVHPRVSLMLKLTSWMRLKAEYGYMYGYPFSDGWKTTLEDGNMDAKKDTYQLAGSPNTALEASTISLGLWFGF